MTTAHRYPKTCDKAALPSQDAEMIESYAEGNQGQGEQYSSLGDDQGGQLSSNQLDVSLPAVPHGYLLPDPSFNVSQSTALHLPLHNLPPSHPRHLYNINDNKSNEKNENNENMPIACVGEDTFVTYDDGEVHSVLASQSPFQTPLPAHAHVPLVHASHSQDFPIHGLQALPPGHVSLAHTPYSQAFHIHELQILPPGHVPLVHAPYSQVFPTHGLQAALPAHFTHTPSLALGSAAAVVTTNQSTLSLASPPGPIPKVPISNLTAIEVANMVNWHVRKANTDGTFWHCTFDGCHSRIKTKGAFKTHLERKHIKTSELPCPMQGCKIKIGYHVDLKRHINQVHLSIGHYCSCNGKWYPRLETLKKRCSRKDKCPGAIDYRVTGAVKKGRGCAPSSKH